MKTEAGQQVHLLIREEFSLKPQPIQIAGYTDQQDIANDWCELSSGWDKRFVVTIPKIIEI